MDKSTTGKLAEVLATIDNTQDMEKFMEQPKVTDSFKTFPEYYRSLPRVKETTDSALIELSGIERSYYYQIMKGKRHPSRDKILRLCIGAGLTLRETTRALIRICCFLSMAKRHWNKQMSFAGNVVRTRIRHRSHERN